MNDEGRQTACSSIMAYLNKRGLLATPHGQILCQGVVLDLLFNYRGELLRCEIDRVPVPWSAVKKRLD
jgi:hypothetical protein